MKNTILGLILVYNAESGAFNAFVDSARKLLMINGCPLCSITHGLTGERSDWRRCKEEIGVPVSYVHRDEISPELRRVVGQRLPCIVAESEQGLTLLLTPEVLERCQGGVADLKGRLRYYASVNQLSFPEQVAAV